MAILAPVVSLSPDALAQETSRQQDLQQIKADIDAQTELGIQLQQESLERLRQQRAEQARLFLEQNRRDLDEMKELFTVKQDNTRVALPIREIDITPPQIFLESDIERSLALDNDTENAETLEQVQENLTAEEELDERSLEEIALMVANGQTVNMSTQMNSQDSSDDSDSNSDDTEASDDQENQIVSNVETETEQTSEIQENQVVSNVETESSEQNTLVLSEDSEQESSSEELDIAQNVEDAAEISSEIADQAENQNLSDSEVATLSEAIDATEDTVANLEEELEENEEVSEAEEAQLSTQLEEARAELAEARAALAARESEVTELKEDREALTTAYCEQRSSLQDLTARVEEFESSTFGQLNERLDMLAQLMMMNMMAQSGPQFDFNPGLSANNPRYRNYGLDNGLRLLTLNDFFHARSLGMGTPQTVYNITGDYYGGNYNPYSFQSAQADMNGQSTGLNFPTIHNPAAAFDYSFGSSHGGVQDSSRFSVRHSAPTADMIRQNIGQINAGEALYRNPSTQSSDASTGSNLVE